MANQVEDTATRQRFAVRSIGSAAARALADDEHGSVLAVFRRSLYVEMSNGRLACVGGLLLGDGPLNARCDVPDGLSFDDGELEPGEDARTSGSVLLVGDRFAFEIADAMPWRPPPAPDPSSDTMERGLDRLCGAASAFSHDIGLGRLVLDPAFHPNGENLVLDRAAAAVAVLMDWLHRLVDDPVGVPDPAGDAEVLIGLGGGLTPSGDDWVGGAMIALKTLGRADVARRVAGWVLPLAQARTGKISIAHLAAAAAGEGAAALHEAIRAICTDDGPGLDTALRDIDAIGHTSGWDALAGAVVAISSCCASPG